MPSKIEYTDETWNVVTGCNKVSPGCAHCFAEREFPRVYGVHRPFSQVYTHPDRLDWPRRWRKARRVLTCSMGDLFHEQVEDAYIRDVFRVMAECPQHTFLVLTKRSLRMRDFLRSQPLEDTYSIPGENVWLGVSVENQEMAIERISNLLDTPGAVRWVSMEPLLEPVSLGEAWLRELDWVVVGGESGPMARPMRPEWARSLRDQCQGAAVPFFLKQIGEWRMTRPGKMERVGMRDAGRLLDGIAYAEYPVRGQQTLNLGLWGLGASV